MNKQELIKHKAHQLKVEVGLAMTYEECENFVRSIVEFKTTKIVKRPMNRLVTVGKLKKENKVSFCELVNRLKFLKTKDLVTATECKEMDDISEFLKRQE